MYGEPIQGFPTIICTILFLGGCQLIALGIIGEYIGKIYNESKCRPPYIVAEESAPIDVVNINQGNTQQL